VGQFEGRREKAGVPLLETSRYGRVAGRSLAAAYRPGGRAYARGQTAGVLSNGAAVLGVVLSLPECGWGPLPTSGVRKAGAPGLRVPTSPRPDSYADLIPTAATGG
jgi:hypothetical protein